MSEQNLNQSIGPINECAGFVSAPVIQQSYVTNTTFNKHVLTINTFIQDTMKLFDKLFKQQKELKEKISNIEKDILAINQKIGKITTELQKKLNMTDFNSTINNIKNNYYSKDDFQIGDYCEKNTINQEIININNKFGDINNRFTAIENHINILNGRLDELEKLELQLQQQGGQNEDLIKTYVNELSKMLLLAKKNLKIYHLNKFLTRPEKIFAFLYNSLRGLQLEQKIKVLQQDKNNFDFNNINNLDIKPETIADRIQKDCNDIGLNVVQNNTLQQMTKICLAIIDNDKKGKNNKKDVTTMINDNTNDLKTIGKNLLQSNKLPAYQQQDQEIINEVLNYHNKFEQYYK